MVKAKVFIFRKQFEGLPKASDFELIEEELPPLKNGEFLCEAVFLSVDPYMRAYAPRLPVGQAFIGSQVAKVLESKNPKFPVDVYVVGELGWRTHTVVDDKIKENGLPRAWRLPDLQGLPLSLGLGSCGMPGVTANLGFLEICQPKAGETVVVTGAAGAVGSTVGQIAKNKGCKVIGIAGSEDKGKWLLEDLKFDHFINYKDADFEEKLNKAAPKGVDCYFDNVGGQISSIILNKMNIYGRVSVCGAISGYNDRSLAKADAVQFPMVFQQIKMEGFLVTRWFGEKWMNAVKENRDWIKNGKLIYKETITEGFENMTTAFIEMLQGANTGKAIIKV